jgi:DNA-binding IclR family transcriptional regulator
MSTAVGTAGALEETGGREHRDPVSKAFRMLEWMADSGQDAWGVRELARGLGIAPSTAHRIVSMLEAAGVLVGDAESTQYHLSLEFLRMASQVAAEIPIRQAALVHMQALVERTNETAYLGVYEASRGRMMYVETVHSSHPLRYVLPQYEWLPMHAGAGGLGILPFLPTVEIEDLLGRHELEPVTDQTITDAEQLGRELEQIRRDGYVLSVGRLIEGSVGIAAPIFGPDDRVIGDVVLALPEVRLAAETAESLGHEVMEAANRITIDLGGTPWAPESSKRPRRNR